MSQPDPRDTDAILGGQNPPPVNAVVLGGLAGVKQRLKSESIAERLQALNNAVYYGENGIDLAITALQDEDISVQSLASKLLRYQFGIAGEEALYKHAPCYLQDYYDPFNQRNELYDAKIGIRDPEDVTYIVKIEYASKFLNTKNRIHIDSLIKDTNICSLRSLIVELDFMLLYQWGRDENLITELIHPILMKNITPNLKSLGINYKYDNCLRPIIDEEAKQNAINGTFELVFNSLVVRQNLKYLSVQIPAAGKRSRYITPEIIDSLKNSLPYKFSEFVG